MINKTITKEEFQEAQRRYDEAVRARAETIRTMREKLGWTFSAIAGHFNISRQAAQKIYQGVRDGR
jgi:DNA-binding transcriptional regulator YiaG